MGESSAGRRLVMDAPKYDNSVGDLLSAGMREDLIQRIDQEIADLRAKLAQTMSELDAISDIRRAAEARVRRLVGMIHTQRSVHRPAFPNVIRHDLGIGHDEGEACDICAALAAEKPGSREGRDG